MQPLSHQVYIKVNSSPYTCKIYGIWTTVTFLYWQSFTSAPLFCAPACFFFSGCFHHPIGNLQTGGLTGHPEPHSAACRHTGMELTNLLALSFQRWDAAGFMLVTDRMMNETCSFFYFTACFFIIHDWHYWYVRADAFLMFHSGLISFDLYSKCLQFFFNQDDV